MKNLLMKTVMTVLTLFAAILPLTARAEYHVDIYTTGFERYVLEAEPNLMQFISHSNSFQAGANPEYTYVESYYDANWAHVATFVSNAEFPVTAAWQTWSWWNGPNDWAWGQISATLEYHNSYEQNLPGQAWWDGAELSDADEFDWTGNDLPSDFDENGPYSSGFQRFEPGWHQISPPWVNSFSEAFQFQSPPFRRDETLPFPLAAYDKSLSSTHMASHSHRAIDMDALERKDDIWRRSRR